MTATHRQDRTFLPPDDYCPLCPTSAGGFPTEIPLERYDLVVFENKFPSLRSPAEKPVVHGSALLAVRPSEGVCEVVCYSDQHEMTLSDLPFEQVRKLTRVWKERYVALSALPIVEYVFIFENKGKEIGVTLSHPHGQIYGYPFIPPVLVQELDAERRHFESTGRTLMHDWLSFEFESRDRIIAENETFVTVVPFFARYPYEVHVAAKRHIPSLASMNGAELDDLAEAVQSLARRYDLLFNKSLPYIMAVHQEPAIPGYEFNTIHLEFYPPNRTADKLKYLAGSESGAGAFINDTVAEETAATLRSLDPGPVR